MTTLQQFYLEISNGKRFSNQKGIRAGADLGFSWGGGGGVVSDFQKFSKILSFF